LFDKNTLGNELNLKKKELCVNKKKSFKHLGLWEAKPRPPSPTAKAQPLLAEPHIDYSARPGATVFLRHT
jgi:hypothetical protein